MPQKRPILVITQDPVDGQVLQAILGPTGHPVTSVPHGPSALETLRKETPCVVLLDLLGRGLEILEQIRLQSPIPVIGLIGPEESDIPQQALKLGAYDYIVKPVDPKKLTDVVAAAMGTEADVQNIRRIGRYEIRRERARGGMGIVYEARDRTLDRLVALKVLLPEFAADPVFELRFLREARAAAKLTHPGIVTVYEAGRYRGKLYIAMELVEGTPLDTLGRRPAPEALSILAETAEALSAAHDAGLVHRDVKPANIILTPKGRVKVLDFGLVAPLKTIHSPKTPAVGTPYYIAPEILEGRAADRRSDIYSLGVVLYEMLSGEHAFEGETLYDLLSNVSMGRVRRPLRTIEGLDPEASALAERMMATRADDRPESMRVIAEAARRLLLL